MSVKLGRFRLFALVVVVCAVLHQVGADEVEISPETARVSLEERCNRAAAREAAEAGDTGVAIGFLLPCATPGAEAEVSWNLGVLQLRNGQPHDAATSIHTALTKDPSNPSWQVGLGVAQLQAGQYKAACSTFAGAIIVMFGKAWTEVTDYNAMPVLEKLLSAFRAAGFFDKAFDVFTRLRVLAGLKAKAQHSEIESGERLSDHAASQVVYSPLHDELLARQAVFAISVGRLMDGVELSALGLRHRLAQRIGANPVEDDPRLIVVAQRVLLLTTSGMESHLTAIARNLLSSSRTATVNSLITHCQNKPAVMDAGATLSRSNLVDVLTSCSTEQALLESAYSSDHASGTEAVHESNAFGWTPLHHAVAFGEPGAVADILSREANISATTRFGLTPLHVSVTWGSTHLFAGLLKAGASITAADAWGRTPLRMWCERGWDTHGADEFVDCRSFKSARRLAPAPPASMRRWPQAIGDGGWGEPTVATPTVQGADAECGIEVAPPSLSPDDMVREFLVRHQPVLIRGALLKSRHWRRVARKLSRAKLTALYGDVEVEVGQIPYASTFGMASHRSTLREVVTDMDVAAPVNASAETWPDYVFASLGNDSQLLSEVFQVPAALEPSETDITTMKAQFYVGQAGTGSPHHFHRWAWNALVHGTKLWELRPPPHALYSTIHPAADLLGPALSQSPALRCIQRSGDVLVVPDSWSHAVLNLGASVGVASEFVWGPAEFSL